MTVYIGVDFHPHQQTVCYCDTADGIMYHQTFHHQNRAELEAFYSQFNSEVVIGLDAGGPCQWFEAMVGAMSHKLFMEIQRRFVVERVHGIRTTIEMPSCCWIY